MTVTPPETLAYGKVVGRFLLSVADTADDPDRHPDAKGAQGLRVTFTPETRLHRLTGEAQPVTVLQDTVTCVADADGVMADPTGAPGVWLVTGVYSVSYGRGTSNALAGFTLPPTHTIEVTAEHTDEAPLDLTTALPYTPPTGVTVQTVQLPTGASDGKVLGWTASGAAWVGLETDNAIGAAVIEANNYTDSAIGALAASFAPVDAPLAPRRRFMSGLDPRATRMILTPHAGIASEGWEIQNSATDDGTTTLDATRPGPFSDRSVKISRVGTNTELRNPNIPAIDLNDGPLVVWVYLPEAAPKGMYVHIGTDSANYWAWPLYGGDESNNATRHLDGWTAYELFPHGVAEGHVGKVGNPGTKDLDFIRFRTIGDNQTAWLGAVGQRLYPTTDQFAPPTVHYAPGVTPGWTLNDGVTLDTTVPAPASDAGSAKIVYDDTSQGLQKGGLSLGPLADIYAQNFIVWVKFTPGMTQPAGVTVEFGDDTFANRHVFYLYGNKRGDAAFSVGDWLGFRINPTIENGTVGIAPANITGIKVKALPGNSTDPVWVGGIQTRHKPPLLYPNGVLTIFFDDGYLDTYTHAAKVLGKYGYPGVVAAIAAYVDTEPGMMTTEQLRELQDRAGWEVAGHSFSPNGAEYRFDQFTPAELEAEFRNLKTWLVSHGFDSDTWVSPGGVSSTAIWEVGRRYFSLHRTVGATVVHGALRDSPRMAYPAAMFSPNYGGTVNKQMMKDIVSMVRQAKSWGSITFHQVTDGIPADPQIITVSDLDEICAYIKQQGVAVRTVKQVIEEANRA